MKKTVLISLFLLLSSFLGTSSATEVTMFGPKQYLRTSGAPDVYTDSFSAIAGEARLIVKNGHWDGSNRIIGATSSASVVVNGVEIFGPNDFNQQVYLLEASINVTEGNSITVELASNPDSYLAIEVTQEIPPPTVTISADPESIMVGESATLTWSSTNADSSVIEPDIGTVDPNGTTTVSPTETTTYTITVTNLGSTATDSVTVTVIHPPSVSISAAPDTISRGESSTLSWTSSYADVCAIEPGIGNVDPNGSTTVLPTEITTYTITATGPGGTATDQTVVTVTGGVEPQPEGWFGEQYEDLIPPDATVTSYDPKRFSVITGLVQDLSDLPIADVSVTILDHSEYGTALTDSNGRFSIPVEGGATTTVVYQKARLLTVHRKVYVPWNDIAIIETIRMIGEDPASTTVTFDGNPETVVTHQSSQVTDEFGTRSCTMVFTGDNHAYQVDAQGNVIQELTTITTRATEYTTPDSMPAILPPNSAYTYCAELSVDGAQRVRFDKPVITWVNNFLGFDVGGAVPVGYYDRDRGVWVPSDNGVVVKLLDTDSDGIVDALDADGDDLPDDLDGDGNVSDEVTGLNDAQSYEPGATFWRVAVTHFTPWDLNWAFSFTPDATDPNPEGEPDVNQQKEKDCTTSGASFVQNRSGIIHEDIPVPGTEMTLHYASNRVKGYKIAITAPASGATVPDSLKSIIVKVEIAGRTFEQILAPLSNSAVEFPWDGLDYLSRPVRGATTAHVSVGFVYELVYSIPAQDIQAFAQAGIDVTAIRTRLDGTLWKRNNITVYHVPRTTVVIAEGFSLSPHHYLSPADLSTLYKGDGSVTKNYARIINTVAGTGLWGYGGDGGPATEADMFQPSDIAVDAESNVYIADYWNARVRKVDPSGIITTVAGNGTFGYSGDNGPATEAAVAPYGLDVDSLGNLYIADVDHHVVRKVDGNGMITTIAGNGTDGYSGDNGPATEAQLAWPRDVAVDAEGSIYVMDEANFRVRKVDPSGIITTVAGNGTYGYSGDGGPATQAQLSVAYGIAVDAWGNLYIADSYKDRVRKVDSSGIITTVAGNGTYGYSGDGGPATDASIDFPQSVTTDALGNLYIADSWNHVIRMVDSSGIITTVAGNGDSGPWGDGDFYGDSGPATGAAFSYTYGVAVDAAGDLYVADYYNVRVRKVAKFPPTFTGSTTPGDIAFADEGGVGYVLSSAGYHKKTIDLDTGAVLRTFGYDDNQNLNSITDQFGNVTTIARDANGVPLSITSPYGLTTTLTIDTNGHLTDITYPDNSFYSFAYTPDGLMTQKTEPNGNVFGHQFDSTGRLTDALDDEGGHWRFSRTAQGNGNILYEKQTGEGNVTSYLDHTYSTRAYTSTITDPTGAKTLFTQSSDGLTVNKSLPCGMELAFKYGLDPEYGFKYVKDMTESTPSALEKLTLRDKTYQDTNLDEISDLITETVTVNGNATTLEHNVLQSQKTITSPEGRAVTMLYEPATLLTTSLTTPELYDTLYGYDARGRLTSISTNTRQTTFAYDAQGFLELITDPENHTTTYTYNAVGRTTGIHRPDGTSVGFTYDNNGNMTVLTNPSTINHGFGYNLVNLNSAYQTPLSGSYSYVYDRDRRLTQINFPSGDQINNVYNKTRLVQIQTPEDNIDLTYLCGTKVGSISKGTELVTYGYDGKLVTSEALSGTLNKTFGYTYNNDFNLTCFTYGGSTVNYTYDSDGLLTEAGSFTISRNTGNGLPEAVTGGDLNLSRTFNGYGEVEGQDFTVNESSLTSWNLERDDNGRITDKAETVNGATSNYVYTYDPMGRLLTVTKDSVLVEEYQYGLNGTRTYEMNDLRGISGRTFTYSDEYHLLTAGDITYEYNVDGFLTSKTNGTDVTTYNYSSRGELLSVTLPNGTIIDYIHDPLGRRIAKLVNGSITEKYLWQGLTRLLAVYDGSDNLLMRFEYADSRMPVAMTKGGPTYYLTYDQVGSLRVVADNFGNVVKSIDYDSFGNIINDTNPTFEVPFGFAGGLHDRDTGLVRFGYRDYDPDVGRWTAKDPILFQGSIVDLYGYCLNDPINWIDPFGFSAVGDIYRGIVTAVTEGAKGGLYSTGQATKDIGHLAIHGDPFVKTALGVAAASEVAPVACAVVYYAGPESLGFVLTNPQAALDFVTSMFPGTLPAQSPHGLIGWGVGELLGTGGW